MAATTSLTYSSDLSEALKSLLALKTNRDNVNFTPYKLAQAIGVDRSLIQRLLNGEVENPRIDTLFKISQFFIQDGFPLTLDDLMQWKTKVIDVQEQAILENQFKTFALYQMNNFNGEQIGTVSMAIPKYSPGTIAVVSDQNIKPIFNAGSVFLVDMIKQPQHENLVMVRVEDQDKLILRKYLNNTGNTAILHSLEPGDDDIKFHLNAAIYKIIGVVIHINVKA